MSPALALPNVRLADGRELPVRIVPSSRARRMAIRMRDASAIELVMPRRARAADAVRFLTQQLDWIAGRASTLPARIPFVPGAAVPVLGRPHLLRQREPGEPQSFLIAEGIVSVGGRSEHFARRTRDGLRSHAQDVLAVKTRALAAALGRPVARIAVREMSTRWGSCSSTGRIGYAWRLIMAPEPIIDYVVAHEVAHLAEMNHGNRFWRLVGEFCPSYQEQRSWLRREGPSLVRYG